MGFPRAIGVSARQAQYDLESLTVVMDLLLLFIYVSFFPLRNDRGARVVLCRSKLATKLY